MSHSPGPLPRAVAALSRGSTIEACIFFQGAEDTIVPPNQLRPCEALRRKGKAVGYFLFSGEQHGFRRAANIKRCLDAQLQFYAEAFLIGLTF